MDETNTPNPGDSSDSTNPLNHDPAREAQEARRAAANDPEFMDTEEPEHDPYAHLRPYHYKKGESGNPAGRPPGIRTLARRMRQAGSLRPDDVESFKNLATKLGIKEQAIKGMDLLDLLTISTMLHAMSGKGSAMNQVSRLLGGTINYTPNNSANKTPEDYKNDSIKFYEAIIEAPDVDMKDKILARAKLDAILGLLSEQGAMGATELADEIRDALAAMDESIPTEGDTVDAVDDLDGVETPPETRIEEV